MSCFICAAFIKFKYHKCTRDNIKEIGVDFKRKRYFSYRIIYSIFSLLKKQPYIIQLYFIVKLLILHFIVIILNQICDTISFSIYTVTYAYHHDIQPQGKCNLHSISEENILRTGMFTQFNIQRHDP